MRIGVNGEILGRGTSGSARATKDVLAALSSDPTLSVDLVERRASRSRSKVVNAARDAAWDLYGAHGRRPYDLWVSPCNIGLSHRKVPHLLVVYDAMVFDHPELFDRGFGAYARALIPFSVRRATVTVTLSEHARRRLLELCGGEPRIEVIPWRGPAVTREAAMPTDDLRVVMLGATEPHKQQALGIRVVRGLRDRASLDVGLDIVGPVGRAEDEVQAAAREADPSASWIRRHVDVPDEVKNGLLDRAWVLLQPSADEGFGLPLLEATARGVPVVHTGAGALKEVLPSAVAPAPDEAGLLAALQNLLDEPAWNLALERALIDSRRFGVEAFQQALLNLVHQVAG